MFVGKSEGCALWKTCICCKSMVSPLNGVGSYRPVMYGVFVNDL